MTERSTYGHPNEPSRSIDNTAWLAGCDAYERGEGCPWGNESARLGWLAARREQEEGS